MFELFNYDFFVNAFVATLFISISCGLIGSYIVSRRLVFISGGITHASFGGLGIAYYLGMPPLFGAMVFSLAASLGIHFLSNKHNIREDSLIGIFWSAGMAIGVLFIYLTPGYVPNLMTFLFGNILTVTTVQIWQTIALSLLIILFFAFFNRPLYYIAFDKEYCKTHHAPIEWIEICIMVLIALCVVLCMKLAGIMLVISYLSIPQAIAGLFYKNFRKLLVASTLISCIGSILGLFVSALLDTPSGASIVICFLTLFIFSWSVKAYLNYLKRKH